MGGTGHEALLRVVFFESRKPSIKASPNPAPLCLPQENRPFKKIQTVRSQESQAVKEMVPWIAKVLVRAPNRAERFQDHIELGVLQVTLPNLQLRAK